MGMLKDFKDFAMQGNMVDMAVGIIIGAAFGTVVKSLVDDLLMPVVSKVFNVPDFQNLFVKLREPEAIPEGFAGSLESLQGFRDAGGVALGWGNFLNNFIAFMLVAFALWMVVNAINKMKKPEPEPAPVGPTEVELLAEIRDSLKK